MKHRLKSYKLIKVFLVTLFVILQLLSLTGCSLTQDNDVIGTKYYVRSQNQIIMLDEKQNILKKIDIPWLADMELAKNGKLYAIQDGEMAYNKVVVIEGDKIKKEIPLKYGLLDFLRYNPYDNKMYLSQTRNITKANENCITVIDTEKDIQESIIPYNKYIRSDMTFTDKNELITSGFDNDPINPKAFIDVIDLKQKKVKKSIPLKYPLTSMVYNDGKIYGTTFIKKEHNSDLYCIDLKSNKINVFKMKYPSPNKIKINPKDDLIYIAHGDGEVSQKYADRITVFDPIKNKIVDELEFSNQQMVIQDMNVEGDSVYLSDWKNGKICRVFNNKIEEFKNIKSPWEILVAN
ncbi:hypothetical protein Q428_13265 [Fervidicella metallireducens AeB]|uniref:Lipoprotein n=1 Tax=Fervidicella metallireducens AeB TaxID=1403537 RepID=A0A017RS19_9CLOT|nr:hypothetical protein [Fervidicella metallireducens]EYE87437.1 hypothetical protein Q428_13265 [Fervidicella metallireducens AeB]